MPESLLLGNEAKTNLVARVLYQQEYCADINILNFPESNATWRLVIKLFSK